MKIKLGFFISLVGVVNLLNGANASPLQPLQKRQETNLGTWKVVGKSGVNAMHAVLIAPRKLIFIDKLEQNALRRPNSDITALSAEYDLDTNEPRALSLYTNTFCSAGSFLSNGTLIEAGGDNGDANFRTGRQTVRVYDPNLGDWYEFEGIMPSVRWYPSMLSLPDGRVLIMGGSIVATAVNKDAINNPTYTFYPPAEGAKMQQFPIDFLGALTMPYNLYPMVHLIPNNEKKSLVFIHANHQSISFDLDTGKTVKQYPKMPGGFRNYPLTGTSIMLPLSYTNDYAPEIMICGGNKAYEITSTAESSCGRLDLLTDGAQWEMDNFGGTPRVMPDATFLVDGTILFVNGAQTGYAGYRKGGGANALWVNEDPVLFPYNYDPIKKTYTQLASSEIPRMYHSVSVLLPDGSILITGSNPQGGVTLNVKYSTEYRVEIFSPPYLYSATPRPEIINLESFEINKGRILVHYQAIITMTVKVAAADYQPSFKAAIIHHGFVTHSQNMSQRYVWLEIENVWVDTTAADQYIITVKLPTNPTVIAPGPSYIYLLNYDAPCYSGVDVLLNVENKY